MKSLAPYSALSRTRPLLGREEIEGLTVGWSDGWDQAAERDGRAARANNKTFHLLVSFPHGTDVEKARAACDSFADTFLHSGDHGDRWRNVRAFHTDRDHPHMHIVIDRRGESGRLLQIHPAAEVNPSLLRELQVNAAAEYGLLLNDTPRVSRGLTSVPKTTEEWRLAWRDSPERGRTEYRQTYAGMAERFARDGAAFEAEANLELAKRFENGPEHLRHHAGPLMEAGQHLQNGGALTMDDMGGATAREITVEDVQAMDDESVRAQAIRTVRDLDELTPLIEDEGERARAEMVRDRIKAEFAPIVPEFETEGEVPERDDDLGSVVEASRTAGIALDASRHSPEPDGPAPDGERTAVEDRGSDAEPAAMKGGDRETDPQETLDDADGRVRAAYEARGMNADRALARIRGGMEAEPETLEYWNDQEVRERMRAGDVPRSVAEREIAELHQYASGTYMAAARAIDLDHSLDASEAEAPQDTMKFRQAQEAEIAPDAVVRDMGEAARSQEREARSGREDAAQAEAVPEEAEASVPDSAERENRPTLLPTRTPFPEEDTRSDLQRRLDVKRERLDQERQDGPEQEHAPSRGGDLDFDFD